MDFADLLAGCSPDFLQRVAERRHIRCSYLENGDITQHLDMVVKTFIRQMEQPDNIEQTLMQLGNEQIKALKELACGNQPEPDQVNSLLPYGFFLIGKDRKPVFHEHVRDILEDWETQHPIDTGQVDNRPSFFAYGAYISMVNALAMRRVRCLVNMRPGRRMLDCIRERLPIAGADFAWGYLYDFLVSTQLLVFDDSSGRLTPAPIIDRSAFYTNLFRYVFSQEGGDRLALRLGGGSPQSTLLRRTQLMNDGLDPTWLTALDMIRPTDPDTLVVTSLVQSFLTGGNRTVVIQEQETGGAYSLPGFKIMADPLLNTSRLATLAGIAELERFDQVFQFALTTCSLIRARRNGMTAEGIITAVRKLTGTCPDDIQQMITDTLDRYGEVRIFSGYPVIVGQDTVRTGQTLQQEDIARHVRYRNEHVLVLEPDRDPLDIKRTLVEAGLIPELDLNREFRPVHREDLKSIAELLSALKEMARREGGDLPDRVDDLMSRLALQASMDRSSAVKSSGSRKSSHLPVEDSGTIGLEDRMEILQFAMSRNYRIRVRYKQKGTDTMETRIIHPRYLDGDFLVAYCESRNADRRFNLYRLEITGLIVEEKP